jgi:hypothetical protein
VVGGAVKVEIQINLEVVAEVGYTPADKATQVLNHLQML